MFFLLSHKGLLYMIAYSLSIKFHVKYRVYLHFILYGEKRQRSDTGCDGAPVLHAAFSRARRPIFKQKPPIAKKISKRISLSVSFSAEL